VPFLPRSSQPLRARPLFLLPFLLLFAFGAQAQDEADEADEQLDDVVMESDDTDEEAPRLPAPDATDDAGASTQHKQLEADAVDSHGCFGFAGRIIGVPALLIGGILLGTGLHAVAVAGTLSSTGLGSAGRWTDFGGNISVGVSLLAIIIGEIALAAGAFGDLFTALDLTQAEADGSVMAWTRLLTWEAAAHTGALGAGLTVGGVLSIIVTIVLPQVFAFDSSGQASYDELFSLGLGTAALGIVTVLVAAALAGISVWLDGATVTAYRRAVGEARAAPRGERSRRVALAEPVMAY